MVARDIFFWCIVAWMGVAVIAFIVLQFVAAPYGRHVRTGWGSTLPNRLAWCIMELPGLLLVPTLFGLGTAEKTTVHYVLVAVYMAHYIHRSLIFPFRIKTRGKRMPVVIMGSAIFFNLMNGSVLGRWLGEYAQYPQDWLWSPQFLVGALLFGVGAGINVQADTLLLHLRKPGETGYKIPQGGLFRYISCPNHFGEIIEWMGFALMGWNVATLSFAVWTCANLLPRARDHHRWYLRQFPDYPKHRHAVFPFVW